MSGLNLTTFDAALKTLYTDQAVQNMVYKNNPLYALTPKFEQFLGRNLQIPLIYGNPQGRSHSFARAQVRGNLTSSNLKAFFLTRVADYSIATIDNETLLASKGDAGAFLEAATVEINGAINSLTRSAAIAMYKSGYGEIGQIKAGSSVSGSSITLEVVQDVTNFEVGMELDVFGTLTGAVKAYGTSGNGLIVTGVNRGTGVITFGYAVNDATNGIPTIAAGDYIAVRGDHSGSTLTKMAGLEAWLPATAPTSGDNFFGVDRSADVTRLAGQRQNSVGQPIEEALIDGAALVAREGGALSHYLMGYEKYSELEKALGSKVQYIDMKVNPEVAFRGIMINGPKGPIKVVPDQNCPANRVFGLQLDGWRLNSLGAAVRVLDTDGLQMLRQSSSDGVEIRWGYFSNISCNSPGFNINIQV